MSYTAVKNRILICERNGGSCVGVELTNVMKDWELGNVISESGDLEAIDRIYELITGKSEKMIRNNWATKDNTILVLQLTGWSLAEVKNFLGSDLKKDFASYGFAEIWIADYTGIDAYGDIELFGLYPEKWWGYHQQPNPHCKPYG